MRIAIVGIIGKITKQGNPLNQSIDIFRNLGLILFFVGNGVITGQQLNAPLPSKWFVYSFLIMVASILCVGFRKLALHIRHKLTRRNPPLSGQMLPCRLLAPGRKHVLMTYGGYDFSATPKELTYGVQTNLRKDYCEVVGLFLEDFSIVF